MIIEANLQSIAKHGAGLLDQVEIHGAADDIVDDFDSAWVEMPT
jgi:hypothetical protein